MTKEGIFYHAAIAEGCLHFSATLEDGEVVNDCSHESYALQVVTYAKHFLDIVGKKAQFCFDAEGVLTDIRSVEGYTAEQLVTIMLRTAIRLSPTEARCEKNLCYGIVEHINKRFPGKRSARDRLSSVIAFDPASQITYLVTSVGAVEFAVPIFLGVVEGFGHNYDHLDTIEKVVAFEQRCHDLGNVARRDRQTPLQLPSLDVVPAA